jgi:hypothetical protein
MRNSILVIGESKPDTLNNTGFVVGLPNDGIVTPAAEKQ